VGKGGRCIGLTTLQPSCANCLEIWDPQPPGILRAYPGLYRDCFDFYLQFYTVIMVEFISKVILHLDKYNES